MTFLVIADLYLKDLHSLHSFGFCWGRLYKRSIIEKYNIRFNERIRYSEDNPWQFDYIQQIKSYAYCHKAIYNYRINSETQTTSQLITPHMKRGRWSHLQDFLAHFNNLNIFELLKNNDRLLGVVWGVLTDAVILDILDKKYKAAKEKLNSTLSAAVMASYIPSSKKEKFFLFLWKHSFFVVAFVRSYVL